MARKQTVVMSDDLTGEEADDVETIQFSLDRVDYEIDLHEANAKDLRDRLAEYIAAARRTGGRAKRGTRSAGVTVSGGSGYSRETLRQMRQWARGQGMSVSDRGRIPSDIVQAWEDAHQGQRAS